MEPRARKLLEEVDDITRSARRQASGHQDILLGTRSVPATLIRIITAEVIAEAAPGAQVRLQPMESVAQLDEILRGRMTLGLVTRRVHERRLEYLEVMQEASAVALPDREPFRALTVVCPQDLAGLSLLVTRGAELSGGVSQPYLDAVAEVVTADNSRGRRRHPAAAALDAARHHLPRLEDGPGHPRRPRSDYCDGPRAIHHPAHVLSCTVRQGVERAWRAQRQHLSFGRSRISIANGRG